MLSAVTLLFALAVPAVNAEEADGGDTAAGALAEDVVEEVEDTPAEEVEEVVVVEDTEVTEEPVDEVVVVDDTVVDETEETEDTPVLEDEVIADETEGTDDAIETEELGGAETTGKTENAKAPPGNNGTVKIDGVEFDSHPNNQPHVGCTFEVDWYNFDANVTSDVTFATQQPTSNRTLLTDSITLDDDDNSGANEGGLDGSRQYTLTFDPALDTEHPKQGYHVKLTINTEGSQGSDVKHKVFWVQGCGGEEPLTSGIIVEKQTIGGDDGFAFVGESAGVDTELSDDESEFFFVEPGTYTVEELIDAVQEEAGWTLISIDCVDDFGDEDASTDTPSSGDVSTGTGTFDVSEGETVKCTFTNELEVIDNKPPKDTEPPDRVKPRIIHRNPPAVAPEVLGSPRGAPLPFTGMNATLYLGLGLMLMLAGAGSLALARQRSHK